MNDAVKEDNRSKLSENQEVDSSDDDEDPEDRPAEINNIQGGSRTKTPWTKAPHNDSKEWKTAVNTSRLFY
jgi:hypothetical protein